MVSAIAVPVKADDISDRIPGIACSYLLDATVRRLVIADFSKYDGHHTNDVEASCYARGGRGTGFVIRRALPEMLFLAAEKANQGRPLARIVRHNMIPLISRVYTSQC